MLCSELPVLLASAIFLAADPSVHQSALSQPTQDTKPTPTPAPSQPATSDPLKAEPAAQPADKPAVPPPSLPLFDRSALRQVNKTGNLLLNPNFESEKKEWWSFAEKNTESWVDFSIVPEKGREKSKAARLVIDSTGRTSKTAISGVVQEVKGDHVPEKLSGWYFVENWEKHTPKVYLQAVVIVWNDYEARQRQLVNAPSIQIAYTFTGVKEAPKVMTNRKFIVMGQEVPKQGEWVHFEVNPRQDFLKLWKIDPGQYEFIRVFFELRYDDMEIDAKDPKVTKATAYYDDLYFGD